MKLALSIAILLAVAILAAEAMRVKPGECRRRFNRCLMRGPSQCEVDSDCPAKRKCCGKPTCTRVCARPRRRRGRPKSDTARCPIQVPKRVPEVCVSRTIISECSRDEECPPRQTCCPRSRCGGGRCVRLRPGRKTTTTTTTTTPPPPPPPRPPRQCPRVPRRPPVTPCRGVSVGRLCEDNDSCPGRRICCPGICGGTSCIRRGDPAPRG